MRYFAFNTSVQYSTFFCERQRQVIPPIHIKKFRNCLSPILILQVSVRRHVLNLRRQPTWRHSILKMAARGKFRKPIENRRYQYP